jgi:HPt (histidine-containing phosphotransfer) domain-containing protein
MAEVLEAFLASLPDRAEALERAAVGNPGELRRLAHQLRGAGGGYGFPTLSTAAALVEHALTDGIDPAVTTRHVEALVALCRRAAATVRVAA